MKKKDLTVTRKRTEKELKELVEKKKKELAKAKVSLVMGIGKNLKEVAHLKKEIAQLLTIIKEKKIIRKLEKEGVK